MPNVESLLRDHVPLQVDCIDRLYLNGYVPLLQRPENVWWFLHEHRQHPIISPALLKRMTDDFVAAIQDFAERHEILTCPPTLTTPFVVPGSPVTVR